MLHHTIYKNLKRHHRYGNKIPRHATWLMLMDIGMNETCTSWIECGDPLGFMTDFVLSTHLQSNKGRVYGVLRHNKPFLVDQG